MSLFMSHHPLSQRQRGFEMAFIGYARVSSYGQSLEVQLEKLSHCDRIFQEKQSARTDAREQLQLCLDYVRDGDSLVITKLDRLARSTRDLLNIVHFLESKQVKLVVLDQQIDTSTPTGRLLISTLGAIAQFENDLRKDRQLQGIALAKRKGIKFGRKFSLTDDQVTALREKRSQGIKIIDLMAEFKISKASVYRVLSDYSGVGTVSSDTFVVAGTER